MAKELIFMNEGGVFVSNSLIKVGGTAYRTKHMTSVSKHTEPRKVGCSVALMGLGLLVLLIAVVDRGTSTPSFSLAWVALAAFMVVFGIIFLRELRPVYVVSLASPSGQSGVFSSTDEELVDRVVAAVSRAIRAQHGSTLEG